MGCNAAGTLAGQRRDSLMVEGFDFVDAAPAKNRAEAAAERVASSFDKYGEDLGDF